MLLVLILEINGIVGHMVCKMYGTMSVIHRSLLKKIVILIYFCQKNKKNLGAKSQSLCAPRREAPGTSNVVIAIGNLF